MDIRDELERTKEFAADELKRLNNALRSRGRISRGNAEQVKGGEATPTSFTRSVNELNEMVKAVKQLKQTLHTRAPKKSEGK